MATTLSTVYPPQVETFMPSFCYNGPAKVWFNVSSYSEDMISQINFIHISMVDQRNNTNVFAGTGSGGTTVYPQYYPLAFNGAKNNNNDNSQKMGYDPNKQMYWLVIPPQVLKTSPYYNVGQYYKVQLRFDLTGSTSYPAYSSNYSDPTALFYWNSNSSKAADALKLASYTNYNEDNFSEWSTGTLLKPIKIPELALQRFKTSPATSVNPSTDVQIAGKLNFKKASGDTKSRIETEQLFWYQIQTLNSDKTIVYYDSNKIYPTAENQINHKIDLSMLDIGTNYYMRIIYETTYGYSEITDFPITIINYSSTTNVTCTKDIDEEKGIITLNISGLANLNGYLIIRRSSHYSNFTKWDLIAAYNISSLDGDTLEIKDKTVESMVGYRYQLQHTNGNTIKAPKYIDANSIIHCDFYGSLFSDKDKILNISFNFEPSNRANAVNRTKTDTLGGQYPIFTQNSKLKYHTYTIAGRISTEDNGESFLPKQELFGTEYYNYRYNYTSLGNTDPHNTECQSIKPNQDWLYEREYRDAVEDWLNNGKPKLFRSMTEGNMIVMLDSISMTPDMTLGRRLYDFNATMYEMGNGKDLESIASFGLFDIIDERSN